LFWDEIDDRGGELLRNVGRKQKYDRGLVVRLKRRTETTRGYRQIPGTGTRTVAHG